MPAPQPLSGVRVVELAQLVAGPLCGMQLADMGADVIKVEPPGGDKGRRFGRARLDEDCTNAFAVLNRNKRSIALNAKAREDREIVNDLLQTADVVISNFRSSSRSRLGMDYESLRRINSKLVSVSLTGFGEVGPYRDKGAVDYVVQAMSGLVSMNGSPGEPVRVGVTVVDISAAWLSTSGVLGALLQRAQSGQGQEVRVSLYDAALSLQLLTFADHFGGVAQRRSGRYAQLGAPATIFDTADGAVVVSAYFTNQWPIFCRIIGLPQLIDAPDFRTNADRLAQQEQLYATLEPVFKQKSTAEWLELLEQGNITCGRVASYEEVESDPQTRVNDMVMELPGVEAGSTFRSLGFPLKFSQSPMSVRRPPPRLDEHREEILGELRERRLG